MSLPIVYVAMAAMSVEPGECVPIDALMEAQA